MAILTLKQQISKEIVLKADEDKHVDSKERKRNMQNGFNKKNWKNVKLLQSYRKLNEQLSTTSFLPQKEGFLSCSTFKKQLILHQGTTAIPSLPSTKDFNHNFTLLNFVLSLLWDQIQQKKTKNF